MCSIDEVRAIVQEENAKQLAAAAERAKNTRKWAISILLTLFTFLSVGIVRTIQNDTILSGHMSDGHPEVIKDMVGEVKETLIRIETTQGHIREDQSRARDAAVILRSEIEDIKKKLATSNASL